MEHSQFEFLCMFYTKMEEEWRVGGGVLVIHLKTSLYRNNTCILLVKFVIDSYCQFLAFHKRQYFMCLV